MKKVLCLIITLIMIVGASVTVSAEDYYDSNEWLASFDGKKINSNFANEQMADDMVNLQPGDSITFKVNLKNDSDGDTYWYMTNEVLQTLEESSKSAEGGAYTYILTYIDSNGTETVLYSSETVGGEETSSEGEGLRQATATLEDHFYLDRLESGQRASVHLFVGLDGETQGNAYQDTLAKLQMNFAVEKVTVASPTVVKGEDKKVEVERVIYAVKTGDNSPIILFSVLILISAGVLLVLVVKQMKARGENKLRRREQ